MSKLWHSLTQLCCALTLFVSTACQPTEADGTHSKKIELCDGSDNIRVASQSGGGHLDDGYAFQEPYGYQFLFVDGHCDFVVTDHSAGIPGSFVRGHLSDEESLELTRRLQLASLPAGVYLDQLTCPDAGSVSLATPDFYGDCTCGCDNAPAALTLAFAAMETTVSFLRGKGAAASGDVELAAMMMSAVKADPPIAWPFDWPISDIDNVAIDDPKVPIKRRAVEGVDAQTARALFTQPSGDSDKRVFVQSEGSTYRLFMRERMAPELTEQIAKFQQATDPRKVRPIGACDGDPELKASFSSALLDGQRLYTWVDAPPQCGMRICWKGEFQEEQPVVAPLRVVKTSNAPACLGTPQNSFQLDLAPIVDAFRAGYPGSAKLEVELSLPGFSGGALTLTE